MSRQQHRQAAVRQTFPTNQVMSADVSPMAQQLEKALPRPMAALHQPCPCDLDVSGDAPSRDSRRWQALHVLRMKQVIERTKLSRATLYWLMLHDQTFPRKLRLTARSVGVLESELDAWILSRAQSRDAVC